MGDSVNLQVKRDYEQIYSKPYKAPDWILKTRDENYTEYSRDKSAVFYFFFSC